jgi:hypothetical protein
MIRMQAISQGLLALRLAGLVATFEQVKKKKAGDSAQAN